MKRQIISDLQQWAQKQEHSPLILRGARQVGKTYVVETFAKSHFENVVTINFELNSQYASCFDELDPALILQSISLLSHQKIIPGKTLLLLDEIQLCARAIQALRYFKEQLPALHVIATGSLLEFALNESNYSMPVGRVTFRYLYPLSLREFLIASGDEDLVDYVSNITPSNSPPPVIHQKLLNLTKIYCLTGGMPAVVDPYLRDRNWLEVAELQSSLLQTYRSDFPKYGKTSQQRYLVRLFERIPLLLGEQFKFSRIDPDLQSRELREALLLLINAGIIKPIHATSAGGIPLIAGRNEKKFKLAFLDIGLAQRACGIDLALMWQNDLMLINQGAFIEQFVAQELIANAINFEPPSMFFWEREKKNSMAEVDFVHVFHNQIIPIEVKAGSTGRLKSLQVFMQEKSSRLAVVISTAPIRFTNNILFCPLYLIAELPRLIAMLIEQDR